MKNFLIVLFFCMTSISCFAGEGDFFGKYRLVTNRSPDAEVMIEFLVNSKGKMKIVKYAEDGNSLDYYGEDDIYVVSRDDGRFYGDIVTFGFNSGSDEDNYISHITIAWVGEVGDRELKVLSSIYIHEDGPNSFVNAEEGLMRLYKWSKKQKRFYRVREI